MRHLALLLACAVAATGCGNWSNEDLEYYAAMPTRDQLTAKLPGATTAELTGEGSRRDPLGEDSKLYTDTKGVADGFNGLLNFLLGALDRVRSYPATTRHQNQRIWGPWADGDHPGFEMRVVMDKVETGNFTFAIQSRPKGGEFFSIVEGTFAPTTVLAKGTGQMVIFASTINDKVGPVKDWENLEKIEIGYITNMDPVQVAMVFTNKPSKPGSLSWGYQELANGNGRMGFSVKGGTDPNIQQFDVFSAWSKLGGFGVYKVVEGAVGYKDATHFECWDKSFKTVFVAETWPGGKMEGDQKNCVTVDGFPP